MNSIGIIGLGRMGMPTAKKFIDAGFRVVGHDLRQEAMEELKSAGGEAVEDGKRVAQKAKTVIIFVLNDQQVIIVDDVVFSGRTLFQALSVLFHSQEPEAIEIVSLIDRGHRRYPVLANIVGEHIPTKVGEHVEVLLNGDHLETVVLFKNS